MIKIEDLPYGVHIPKVVSKRYNEVCQSPGECKKTGNHAYYNGEVCSRKHLTIRLFYLKTNRPGFSSTCPICATEAGRRARLKKKQRQKKAIIKDKFVPEKHYSPVYLRRLEAGIFNKAYTKYIMSMGYYTDGQARKSLRDLKQKMKNGYTVRPVIIK